MYIEISKFILANDNKTNFVIQDNYENSFKSQLDKIIFSKFFVIKNKLKYRKSHNQSWGSIRLQNYLGSMRENQNYNMHRKMHLMGVI